MQEKRFAIYGIAQQSAHVHNRAMTKAKNIRVTAILTAEQYNALAAKSLETGAPMTELIRRMIEAGLQKKAKVA